MSAKQQRGLGKGLQALIGYEDAVQEEQQTAETGVRFVDVLRIDPNPQQARKRFDKEALEGLAQSIAIHGVIQPLIVGELGERFRLIAGERRWRAAKIAGLDQVPVIITQMEDRAQVEVSLVENLQREDLNPLEEAAGIKFLMDEYGLTQELAAERVGKSRSAVANAVRLLTLSGPVQDLIWTGAISAGHARVLAGIEDTKQQERMALLAVENGLSVREMEALRRDSQPEKQKRSREEAMLPELYDMQERMQAAIGMRVRITGNAGRGRVMIEYHNREEMERLCALLQGADERFT